MSVISSKTFVAALRDYGVDLREHKFGGVRWEEHDSPGGWNPKGIMNHHTVTGPDWSVDRTVQLLWKGRSTLPGPLCHVGLDRKGVAHLVGWRNANHAGKGDDDVLKAVIAESYDRLVPNENNTDGNPHFYGIEVFNDGVGEPYPAVQLEALFRINAAICDAHGWSAKSCIHHKEWQRGKIDMSWRGDLRKEIARVLSSGPDSVSVMATSEAIIDRYGDYGKEIVEEANRTRLALPLACALVEQESNFKNIFGCDLGSRSTPPWCRQNVTRDRVQALIRHVRGGGTSNGVGLTQLTYLPFIERAEREGGAHDPRVQCRVGFAILHDHVRDHGKRKGLGVYNGGPKNPNLRYADEVLRREGVWKGRLGRVPPGRTARGTVDTNGTPLTVRAGPGASHKAVGQVADGENVTIYCQTQGSTVTGTFGTSNIWDRIGSGRYIADAYVFTGSDGRVAGPC